MKLNKHLVRAVLGLIALLALAACGSPAATASAPGAGVKPGTASAPGEGVKPSSEGTASGPSVASITNPGGLPPSAAQTNNTNTGQETMVLYRDTQSRYQVLFVNGWTTSAGSVVGSIKSSFQDRSVQIAIVNSGGPSAMAFATADEANVKLAVSGYQRLALKTGQIPYGAVANLISSYQAGQNPVTGKSLSYIAARVYVPRQGTNDLAIITVTGPAPFYGDLTQIFDRIVNSFKWL
jgi:hypothetical protein